jgi:uncharacterized protein involved in exopolysaccharide biosynthesis
VFTTTTGDYAAESFQAHEYIGHLKGRWKFVTAVCAAAGVLALIVSVLLPKEYTATASVVIEPPAGNDPRLAITVSPVYLESLRAYELFASSDTLFERAIDRFHLREAESSKTREALKRGILKVEKVKDTKMLEIAVTLHDPRQAQAVAQFLADETVNLSRTANLAVDQDLLADARTRAAEAEKRLEQEQSVWREFSARQPYESLRADLEALADTRERVERDLTDSRAELAEISNPASGARAAPLKARVESLEKQDADLARQIQAKAAVLSDTEARGEQLQQRVHSAQVASDSVAARERELEGSTGMRGERLRVMDPGVAPERASFPNIGLNVILAIAVALIAAVTYLTLTFRPLGFRSPTFQQRS